MPFYSEFFAINLLAVILAGLRIPLNRYTDSRPLEGLYWITSIGLLVAVGIYAGFSGDLPDFSNSYYPSGQMIIQDPANLYGPL